MRITLACALVLLSRVAMAGDEGAEPTDAPKPEVAPASSTASERAPVVVTNRCSLREGVDLRARSLPSAAGSVARRYFACREESRNEQVGELESFRFVPGAEIFASYAARSTTDAEPKFFHQFDLPRLHLSVDGDYHADEWLTRARVVVEGVRSTDNGALIGVGGDSLLVRLREAYALAAMDPPSGESGPILEARGGVIPTPVVAELDGTSNLRVLGTSAAETARLLVPADLGAAVRVSTAGTKNGTERSGQSYLQLAAYNGDGYASREQNRGKSVELAGLLRPLPKGLPELAWLVVGSLGSTGPASVRAHRASTALLYQGARVRAGLATTFAYGVDGDGKQKGLANEAFVRIETKTRIPALFSARVQVSFRDLDASDRITSVTLGVGARLLPLVELHLIGERSLATKIAESTFPGADFWEVRPTMRAFF